MVEVKLSGIDNLASILREVPKRIKKKIILPALRAGARLVVASAKRIVRKRTGNVAASITARNSKTAARAGDLGVFVNVRPAKGALLNKRARRVTGPKGRSRLEKGDPFYWRWLEFGWSPRGPGKSIKGGHRRAKMQRSANLKGGAKHLKFPFLAPAVKESGVAGINLGVAKIAEAINHIDRTGRLP